MTDKQLRAFVSAQPFNGVYASQICRKCCGYLMSSTHGDTRFCPIVDMCEKCFGKTLPRLGE